ncbi:Uncharacterized protein TCM_022494 [Theobroma cacao]|uniref:Uncharacterized protein n=1 Tax=Theobroma cacao TaxID=3641 RepID=A0A061F102_THECC|nr:Uncharacterized protein TCM_022494 [Theobroma cacao]
MDSERIRQLIPSVRGWYILVNDSDGCRLIKTFVCTFHLQFLAQKDKSSGQDAASLSYWTIFFVPLVLP